MKVAISSASFADEIAAGGLTQLEWLERCAGGIGADGVIFERTHFARTDRDYIAQIKKVTVDLGLVPLALDDGGLFDPQSSETQRLGAIELAAGLGVLFIVSRLPAPGDVPPATFIAVIEVAKAAVRAAKAANVTLLVAPAAGTLGAEVPDLRHFCKDVDSAWLHYALPAGTGRDIGTRERALVVMLGGTVDVRGLAELTPTARPWIVLTGPVDAKRVAALHQAAAQNAALTEAPA